VPLVVVRLWPSCPMLPRRATSTMSFGLEAEGLVRTFGGLRAVDDVSFQLAPGELLTVFGPNGAGKTTLLRMLAGTLRPTAGDVRVAGEAADVAERAWRARVGVVSHQSLLYAQLSARENLYFYGRLFGLKDLGDRVDARLEAVGLADRASTPTRTLSRGLKQRLALARALLHDPEVVLLDEPYTGLDAHASAILRDQLASLKDGRRTVVLVTHNLGQGLEIADRVAIQFRGRFVALEDRGSWDAVGFERFYRATLEETQ
jgi:heme exporter protein A